MTWKRRKVTQRREQEEKKRSQPTITWIRVEQVDGARRRRRKSARHGNRTTERLSHVYAGQIYLILVVHAKITKSRLERERKKVCCASVSCCQTYTKTQQAKLEFVGTWWWWWNERKRTSWEKFFFILFVKQS